LAGCAHPESERKRREVNEDRSGRTPLEEDKRIDTLQERIDRASLSETERTKVRGKGVDSNYRLGSRVLADLLGGIGGGLLIGWLLDRLLGTSPWLLLVFLFLGIVVAFRNIWKVAGGRPE
jgi:ATP synthase protein I